ncbi:hypothetical protein HanXRQr2_Chr13g0586891 [Helianthus annuus]|uniref:Uncharacterized protein n=1 Tax=Helianthus annuus TaxID=4232 RepID=A0A9K3EHQ2_HELAN|nr:hypothetical protein HanXRQr2_Chr13g0586891 [Helianthus annuus]KAJ0849101.1 hypothetical protein HanPSC8_Chr13g0565061 [Helianthus annuus]
MYAFPVFDQSRFRFLTYESCECYKNRSLLHRFTHTTPQHCFAHPSSRFDTLTTPQHLRTTCTLVGVLPE